MSKWIKNNSGLTKTWVGQQLSDQAYYEIQPTEESVWSNNSTLLTDIGSGDAVVAKDDSTSNDITDVSTAINYLKNIHPQDNSGSDIVRLRAFHNTDNMKFRGTGVKKTCTAGTDTNLDYKLTEDRYINGVEIMCKDHIFGDSITFQAIDIDNVLGYGAGTVLDEFATDWYVNGDCESQGQFIVPYPALVLKDLYIRLVYTSGGGTNVELRANLFLHKK